MARQQQPDGPPARREPIRQTGRPTRRAGSRTGARHRWGPAVGGDRAAAAARPQTAPASSPEAGEDRADRAGPMAPPGRSLPAPAAGDALTRYLRERPPVPAGAGPRGGTRRRPTRCCAAARGGSAAALHVYGAADRPAWAEPLRAELGWLSTTLAREPQYAGRLARLLEALHRLSTRARRPRRRWSRGGVAGCRIAHGHRGRPARGSHRRQPAGAGRGPRRGAAGAAAHPGAGPGRTRRRCRPWAPPGSTRWPTPSPCWPPRCRCAPAAARTRRDRPAAARRAGVRSGWPTPPPRCRCTGRRTRTTRRRCRPRSAPS